MALYLTAFCAAALFALLMTPVVIRVSMAMNLMDRPGTRKVHSQPIPRIGGTIIALSMLVGAIPVLLLHPPIAVATSQPASQLAPAGLTPAGGTWTQIIVLMGLSLCMCAVGLVDDIYNLKARVKLGAQILAAMIACWFDIRIHVFGAETLPIWFSWLVTMIWIVGITNAVNLINGLDGLAAGISAITCVVIAVFAIYTDQAVIGMLVLAMLGSLAGFLFYNFNPARVFMGDSGTLFLGFFLASASVMGSVKSQTMVGLALPVLSLGLPVFDTLFSILRRMLERRSPFAPDRDHIHHRLIRQGLKHRTVVLLMYLVTVVAAGLGMFMMILRNREALVVFLGVSLMLVVVFRIAGAVRFRDALAKFQRNLYLARQTRVGQQNFERLQLRLSEASSVQQWWRCIKLAAREMGFCQLDVHLSQADGSTLEMSWKSPTAPAAPQSRKQMTITLKDQIHVGQPMHVQLQLACDEPLETIGSRLALFGRLLEEGDMERLDGEQP